MNNNRHKIIDGLICSYCGNTYSARKQRVDIGLARFCSINCCNKSRMKGTNRKYVRKENGKISYDKMKGAYYVYWFDSETLKRKTTSFARWFWEVNIGTIPAGYVASYKDKNSENINPDN